MERNPSPQSLQSSQSQRRRRLVAAGVLLGLAAGRVAARAAAEPVTVFAAASLADALRAAEPALGAPVRFSFAASSTLARQIEQGAPAHVFVSADERWMDHLERAGRIDAASRRVLATNRLVVVVPRDAARAHAYPHPQPHAAGEPTESPDAIRAVLLPADPGARVASGDPAHVPAGRYAEQALRSLGLWERVAPRLVRADNVRSALAFVERGEAAAGIVYATDAAASSKVRVAARFAASSHAPVTYPAALVAGAPPAARALFERLFAPPARAVLQAAGFAAPLR